jgi:predicted TIM-barrel fold metal-dependent hydrolase
MDGISRRSVVLSMLAPPEPVIDSHIHLFEPDKFPYHPRATYKPPAAPLRDYLAFAKEAGITGAVVVHPEPYQDDHRYLIHCLRASRILKGTCLFDPTAPATPARMRELVSDNKERIVALRIHVNRARGVPPTNSGPIRDRDLKHPNMKRTWRAAGDLGLAVQMHCIPAHAPEIAALAKEFSTVPVVIDHMARAGQGTADEYKAVLEMAKLGNVYMKFSGLNYSSKAKPPYADLNDLVKRTFDAYGPERMMWGVLGMNMGEFRVNTATFNEQLRFASAADRAKIRGLTAARLYRFA